MIVEKQSILEYADFSYYEQQREQKAACNSRQIRNGFQIAVALAEYDNAKLGHSQDPPIKAVLRGESFREIDEEEPSVFGSLMQQILEYDPEKRPLAIDVLQYPWFTN
ncbi:hypothetical protein P154DRAFT_621027 [Amniculicola lignicola CBS 123094]|uniref:AAA+ ATPase lid domain-containing protein n=1 Tax=Amniculicola lignicola CBS 123094 TaxID=1392246 RepID=A0A6A5WP34_9PLEO|nr:hypothetical protein P154DRAFT_621027 [Amniculicola lignicola CBS 123094]